MKTASALACLGLLTVSSANATTFNVNISLDGSSVVGTIATNVSSGVLDASNITDWNLVLSNPPGTPSDVLPASTDTLTFANSSALLFGTSLQIIGNDLVFNFSSSDTSQDFDLHNGSVAGVLFADAHDSGNSNGLIEVGTTTVNQISGNPQGLTFDLVPVTDTIGIAETPLPAALPLFATGLGAMGLLGWRRKRSVQA